MVDSNNIYADNFEPIEQIKEHNFKVEVEFSTMVANSSDEASNFEKYNKELQDQFALMTTNIVSTMSLENPKDKYIILGCIAYKNTIDAESNIPNIKTINVMRYDTKGNLIYTEKYIDCKFIGNNVTYDYTHNYSDNNDSDEMALMPQYIFKYAYMMSKKK